MIIVRGKDTEGKDWGEMVGHGHTGVKMKWLIHKEVGDDSYRHRFALRELTYEQDRKPTPMHRHEYVEALYIISGKLIFRSEREEVELGPGDVAYTAPNELHGTSPVKDKGGEPLRAICCIDCVDGGENCIPWAKGISIKE